MFVLLIAVLLQSIPNVLNRVPFPYSRFPSEEHRTSTIDLIESQGYPTETHYVTTEDGYILAIHRIPSENSKATPVLYLHGYEAASSDIVIKDKSSGLGFILSDRGYDVWLINFRGNRYSRNHTTLDASKNVGEYWWFSWWEMGKYDIPAVMDYILSLTEKPKLQILGHGQGMQCLYVMFSTQPQYASKISLVSAMSPISYTGNTAGMLKWMTPLLVNLPDWMTEIAFLTPSSEIDKFTSKFCAEDAPTQDICYNTLFLITGFDLPQQNRSELVKQLQHFPAGTSARTIVHSAQNIVSDRFQAYDWGPERNMEIYNSPTPPQVDLGKANVPHALYLASGNDFVSQPGDYNRLIQELPNIVKKFTVSWKDWNHMDFITGIGAPRLLYHEILTEMDKYKTPTL